MAWHFGRHHGDQAINERDKDRGLFSRIRLSRVTAIPFPGRTLARFFFARW